MLSVVMPAYNAEKYLKETIDSIIDQSFEDIEIICVNDASDDNTLAILEGYARKDNRFFIINNEQRRGAAESRNLGLEYAQGEYVAFLDADDIYNENMFEEAYHCATENNLDIVAFWWRHVRTEEIHKRDLVAGRNNSFYDAFAKIPFEFSKKEPVDLMTMNCLAAWNKLFKRSFLIKNEIKFQDLSSCNDVLFVQLAYCLAKRIMFLNNDNVMVYVRDHDEISRISFNRDPMCCFYAFERLLEELSRRECLDENMDYIYLSCFQTLVISGIGKAKTSILKRAFYDFLAGEGIDRLLNYDKNHLLDISIREMFMKFTTHPLDSRWFESEYMKKYVLPKKKKALVLLTKESTLLWGCGKNGKLIVSYAEENGINFTDVVDSDFGKKGCQIGSYRIMYSKGYDFSNVKNVLVSVKGAFSQIQNELQNESVNVIYLYDL